MYCYVKAEQQNQKDMAATVVKLPDSTIQMIAAGEVITRPVNVIKELLENCLDAGATNIRITIEQGGLKLIEIIDNGHGIARANAELLCRRYTTSKLRTANDLSRISTFGFRGEALASISEMAEVEVKTFNMASDCMGWHAKYKSGELIGSPIDTYTLNSGTQIRVTNLFADVHQRQNAIKASFIEEKKATVDLVMRYAVHHRKAVTISLKETHSSDLICLLAPMDIESCIGMFFGLEMQNNLIELEIKSNEKFRAEARVVLTYKKSTGSTHHSNFILFVNNRLVECQYLKKEIEVAANDFIGIRENDSLIYVALEVPSCDVDVNTHPAKATVALHYQADIITLIVIALTEKLKESYSSKAISQTSTQVMSQNFTQSAFKMLIPVLPGRGPVVGQERQVQKRQFDIVHNDSTQKTLSQFPQSSPQKSQRIRREIKLLSISQLKDQVSKEKSKETSKIIKNSVFVGLFDHDRALIQHETKLYAINLKAYLKEQYYQFYLFDFGNFPPIEILPPGNKIKFIISTYLEDIKKHDSAYYEKLRFKTCESIIDELLKHSAMFEDYLNLELTKDEIITIPCVMPNEIPNLTFLGKFLVDLIEHVDYTDERECLRMTGRVLADFYSEAPSNLKGRDVHRRYHDTVEKKLYVAIKNYLLIPEWLFVKENICQISDTKDLYKVFERC